MIKLYSIVALAGVLVRQFCLPNPFVCFGDKAVLYNWIAEPIIHVIAFSLVGLVYQQGDNSALGSILYLLTYALIVGALWVLGIFAFAWWWIVILTVEFIGISIGIRWLSNKLCDEKKHD